MVLRYIGFSKIYLLLFSPLLMFDSVTPWTAACQASLSFIISPSLHRLTSVDLVMPSNHLALCRPLLLLPSISPIIRVSSNDLALQIRWPKYWSFSCSISPSNEYSELISFRIDWFDLLAVQGTLLNSFKGNSGTSLEFQGLGLCASPAGGLGSMPGQKGKIPHAAMKIKDPVCSKIN